MKIETIRDHNSITIQTVQNDGEAQEMDPGLSFSRERDYFAVHMFQDNGTFCQFIMPVDSVKEFRDALTQLIRNKGQ